MLKLVLVEDEEIIRKSLVLTVDWLRLGCVVVGEAENGRRGLEVILEQKPHIVITDIKMPVMNGMDMLAEAARHVSFAGIILSGFSEFEYARQAIRLGIIEYVLKPVDETLLAEAVRKAAASLQRREKPAPGQPPLVRPPMPEALPQGHNPQVRLALERIHNAYADRLSVEALAAELGVSESYLHRKIKEETGQTFLHLLHRQRVREAICLMELMERMEHGAQRGQGALRIHEISTAVGFTDYKHFCSVFKKITTASPTDFMRAMKSQAV